MIRRATAEDLTTFWGRPPRYATKAHVVEVDGRVVAVGGVHYLPEGVMAFSDITDEAAKHPKQVMRCAHAVMGDIEKIRMKVFAKRDLSRPTAHGFLTHLGFMPLSEDVYVLNREHHVGVL